MWVICPTFLLPPINARLGKKSTHVHAPCVSPRLILHWPFTVYIKNSCVYYNTSRKCVLIINKFAAYFVFDLYRVNRLSSLPRGLGTASGLEILDLTYNNLQKESLPGNFSVMSK